MIQNERSSVKETKHLYNWIQKILFHLYTQSLDNRKGSYVIRFSITRTSLLIVSSMPSSSYYSEIVQLKYRLNIDWSIEVSTKHLK